MKTTIKSIILIALASFAISCEKTVSGVNLRHDEKLVIQALLEPNQDQDSIFVKIEKTLPPLESYSPGTANIDDAEAYIEVDGKKIRLQYIPTVSDGNFGMLKKQRLNTYFTNEVKVTPGKTYNLSVKWKNLSAQASTTVPSIQSDSIYDMRFTYDSTRYSSGYIMIKIYLKCKYYSNENSCVVIITKQKEAGYTGASYSFSDLFVMPGKNESAISALIGNKYSSYDDPNRTLSYFMRKYDYQYVLYNNTKSNGNMNSDPFSTSGLNVRGNIKGNGIGYFFSCDTKEIIVK